MAELGLKDEPSYRQAPPFIRERLVLRETVPSVNGIVGKPGAKDASVEIKSRQGDSIG
jgi:hypothetical protein